MITFADALEQLDDGERPSMLLGNGFSRAWKDAIFSYENLLSAAKFENRDDELRGIFEKLGTYDFEAVMRALESTRIVLESYGGNEALIKIVGDDQEVLKKTLISVISNTHPSRPSEVLDSEYRAARLFCSNFFRIFTLNYDLLFYWIRNINPAPEVNYLTDDGFRAGGFWLGHGTDQQVYFLHGALHLYEEDGAVKKHSFKKNEVAIVDLVRDNLNNGIFPIFVSEPSAEKKKIRIEHNPYLNFCYSALRDEKGAFFIHGHSFDSNDRHIFDQLRGSGVEKYFVGIFGDENSAANTMVRANARAFLEKVGSIVTFYDAATAPIWK